MDICRKCQQKGDTTHDCGMPLAFRQRCGAVVDSKDISKEHPDITSLFFSKIKGGNLEKVLSKKLSKIFKYI